MLSSSHRGDTLVFYDPAYPQACAPSTLRKLVPGSFQTVDAAHLAASLEAGCKLLVSFHGPYFPKRSWLTLLRFLEGGGNMAIFGGMPFARMVNDDGEVEPEQDAYTRQLYLGPFFQVATQYEAIRLAVDYHALFLGDCLLGLSSRAPGQFWSFYPKLTQVSDHPEDTGSAGPFDTILQPLILALATAETGEEKVATPVLALDQRSGRFRGGRWLISAWEPESEEDWLVNGEAIQRLIALAAEGAVSFDVRPALACYQPGETPALVVTARSRSGFRAHITVYHADSYEEIQTFEIEAPASPLQYEQYLQLAPQDIPGLYRVGVEYRPSGGQVMGKESGFWIWDEALVEATRGKRLIAGRDYFYQGERIFPVCGTTYMDSRVQRRFLHLPNPTRWDRDMGEMKAAGINLLRTGLWTAWREAFLRAFDAFVMTICKHDLQLIFTFFTFFPLLFEGENPWLDPRSIEAQQDFVALLARRYARVELLSWDLINEPSFGDPAKIFAQRPLPHYDRFEIAAFQQWLQQRYTLSQLQLHWRETPTDLPDWQHVLPPREDDYATSIRDPQYHARLKVADYTHFSQEMFAAWAAQMVAAIRAAGGRTLVGVGQDESGSRIAPQFYARSVDYTTTHPWWNIDDLLWDMLLDKTPDKPNLIEETGVMLARDVDGRPWRSEDDAAHLLERKLITGLAANGAGLIQWLWHTNSYMTSDNENSIGLVRADGSAKPELAVMKHFAGLMQALDGQLLEAPSSPAVWVVIPYSQWFVRPELGYPGTQQAIRVLGYELGIIPQMIGEQQILALTTVTHRPRLVIIPALQMFDPASWDALLRYVHAGGTALVSGVISRDQHNLPFDPQIDEACHTLVPMPVARYEQLEDSEGQSYQLTFADEKVGYVKKTHNRLNSYRYGAGNLLWCGLPLELANEASTLATIYQQALTQAQYEAKQHAQPGQPPLLIVKKPLREGTLFLVVSESSSAQQIELDEGLRVTIAPNRAGAAIVQPQQSAQTFGGLAPVL